MRVSIMGDSISTFQGSNPNGYSVFYKGYEAQLNNVDSETQTWWYQVIHHLNGELCVNNSFSGSRVSGLMFPAANSEHRIRDLGNTLAPDLILIYIGFNDFGYCVPIGKTRLLKLRMNPNQFFDAYSIMISRIKQHYPKSKIVCATLMETHIKQDASWSFPTGFPCQYPLEQYNCAIRIASKRNRIYCADLHEQARLNGSVTYETLDGVHPTSAGHKTLAQYWIKSLYHIFH